MIQGRVEPGFEPVAVALAAQLRGEANGPSGGAAVCVYHRGRPVVDVWAGARTSSAPWQRDTLAMSFSTTKGVMATLLHVLVDRHEVDYDAPVARYWPEFAQEGKGAITVRDVLSHRAGLFSIRSLIDHADRICDWEHMTRALAGARAKKSGEHGYHALTYGWLVGEIVRRVTGARDVSTSMAELLAAPLGERDLFLGAPRAERHRVATLIQPARARPARAEGRRPGMISRARRAVLRAATGAAWRLYGLDPARTRDALLPHGSRDVFFSDRLLDAEIPAMNGFFTARALARMYAMLANGGELDGVRLLSPDTVRRATEIQTRARDAVVGFPMRWRLGYHLVATTRGVLVDAFGHFGYGGSGAWADPARKLAVAMTLNRVAGTPFGDMRLLRIGAVAARCAERR